MNANKLLTIFIINYSEFYRWVVAASLTGPVQDHNACRQTQTAIWDGFVMGTVCCEAYRGTYASERMALLKNGERKSDRRQGTRHGPDVYGTANRGGKLASENRSNEAWRSLSSHSLAVNEALPQPNFSHEAPGPRRTNEWDARQADRGKTGMSLSRDKAQMCLFGNHVCSDGG